MICGIILFFLAFLKGEILDALIAFAIGMPIGLLIDWVGIKKLRWWILFHQPFLRAKYFAIVCPVWGVISLTTNLLWNWMETPWWIPFVGLTVCMIVFYEVPNLWTKSWKYNTPTWLVIAGWFPMVLSFRLAFILIR